MSLSFYSTPSTRVTDESHNDERLSFTALNLFAALSISELKFFTSSSLELAGNSIQVAGHGGHAVIEVGAANYRRTHRVAVKRNRVLSTPMPSEVEITFQRHLEQLTLELRILGHTRLRKHPNIVDLLGVCVDEVNASPRLALVLEYAALGSLDSFLDTNSGQETTFDERISMILQVAKGLKALHTLKICHADVKTQNILVFRDKGISLHWNVKISDFGQSLIAPHGEPDARVRCHVGTRLLNAPEIRTGQASQDPLFNINAAIRTDIFSFGLLAWEVLKAGRSFLDSAWLGQDLLALDVDTIEHLLNQLPVNGLCDHALEFLESLTMEDDSRSRLKEVLRSALEDISLKRSSMSNLVDILSVRSPSAQFDNSDGNESLRDLLGELDISFDGSSDEDADVLIGMDSLFGESMGVWTSRHSLYDVLFYSVVNGSEILRELPIEVEKRILAELRSLATAGAIPDNIRADAAMTISECFSIGFGGVTDTEEVVHWLQVAASLGITKAALWYHRVCCATGISPATNVDFGHALERRLTSMPSELHLAERIRYFNQHVQKKALNEIDLIGLRPSSSINLLDETSYRLTIFNQAEVDELLPLHLASWLGQDTLVEEFLKFTDASIRSTLGLDAVHYACLGGHISTLRLLVVVHGVPLTPAAFHSITPLHLAIFFPPEDIADALEVLLSNGASVQATTKGEIKWEAHDLGLGGTPIIWAIDARNQPLVKHLTPQYPSPDAAWVFHAIQGFCWEMLEDLLALFPSGLDAAQRFFTRLSTIHSPFAHWISHGCQHITDIEKTVQICNTHGLIGYSEDGCTDLVTIISNAKLEDDFHLIEAILSVSSASYVKHSTKYWDPNPAMSFAFSGSRHNVAWTSTIRRLADFYTIEELQQGHGPDGNLLMNAVCHDSLIGARVLLEKGVEVNETVEGSWLTTAIHECIATSGTVEMIELLMEFGARLRVEDLILGRSALQFLLLGLSQRAILELLLNYEHEDAVYAQILHELLIMQFYAEDNAYKHARENLRYVLGFGRLRRYINSPGDDNCTLVQRAAWCLHADSVRLLLDAGADAGIPFVVGQARALPLQLACTQGRGVTAIALQHPDRDDAMNRRRRAQAMEVAKELLEWHHAQPDGPFSDITELHLACRMAMTEEISRLMQEGYDPCKRGRWPGHEADVSPRELVSLELKEDHDAGLNFPVPPEIKIPDNVETPSYSRGIDSDTSSEPESTLSEDV